MPKPTRGSNNDDRFNDQGVAKVFSGGQGNDTYVVGNENTKIIEKKNGGDDNVYASVDFSLADWLEVLVLTGADNLVGSGNTQNNHIEGNDGDNKLYGLEGNDTLAGGIGNDTIFGGDGEDTAVFSGSLNEYQVIVSEDVLRVASDAQSDILHNVEWLQFDDGKIRVSEVTVDVPPPPTLTDDSALIDEDGAIVLNALANDQGTELTIISVGEAELGLATLLEDGRIEYLPHENATGEDTFSYTIVDANGVEATATITIGILPVNDDPTAMDDDFVIDVSFGEYASVRSVLENDSDTDGDTLAVQEFQRMTEAGGVVTMDENGFFTYTMPSAYDTTSDPATSDAFTYTVVDNAGAESLATVHLELIGEEPTQPPAPDDGGDADGTVPDYALDALIPGDFREVFYRWNDDQPIGSEVTISFSFLEEVPDYYSDTAAERNGFAAMSDAQRDAVLTALDQISSFTNITFVEATDGVGELAFGTADLPSGAGWAYGPSVSQLGGDVWIDNVVSSNSELGIGEDGFKNIMHEIGHALGLEHPHDGDQLPDEEMSRSYTVMSYSSPDGTAGIEPSTYMMYDIAALQYLYGTDTISTSGDDIYDVSNADDLVMTIWDSGGYDILTAENATNDVVLDLNPGEFFTSGAAHGFYGMTNNISIAFGTTIEVAIGGQGNDILIGNSANNELTGGAGQDDFVMNTGWGSDRITDFELGADRIDLSTTELSFGDLTLTDEDGNAVILYDDNKLQLDGLNSTDLTEEDFLFGGMV